MGNSADRSLQIPDRMMIPLSGATRVQRSATRRPDTITPNAIGEQTCERQRMNANNMIHVPVDSERVQVQPPTNEGCAFSAAIARRILRVFLRGKPASSSHGAALWAPSSLAKTVVRNLATLRDRRREWTTGRSRCVSTIYIAQLGPSENLRGRIPSGPPNSECVHQRAGGSIGCHGIRTWPHAPRRPASGVKYNTFKSRHRLR